MAKTISIDEVKRRAEACGATFFDGPTVRFFRSRLPKQAFQGSGGTYFVTSEQQRTTSGKARRLYSVRKLTDVCQPEGSVETVGQFQAFKTPDAAKNLARKLADGDEKALAKVTTRRPSGLRGWSCGG